MKWFAKSLNHKFTLATIAGFLVSSLLFFGLCTPSMGMN